jgi:hypothetical protein
LVEKLSGPGKSSETVTAYALRTRIRAGGAAPVAPVPAPNLPVPPSTNPVTVMLCDPADSVTFAISVIPDPESVR